MKTNFTEDVSPLAQDRKLQRLGATSQKMDI